MAVLLAEYRVRDVGAFRAEFAAFDVTRREMGTGETRVFVSLSDPLVVNVLLGFASADAARVFAADPRRAEALARAGVVEHADEVMDEVPAG